MLQDVYRELDRPKEKPLRNWTEAFIPCTTLWAIENVKDKWKSWEFKLPVKPGDPSQAVAKYSLRNIIETLYAFIREWLHFFQMCSVNDNRNILCTLGDSLKGYNLLLPLKHEIDHNTSLTYNVKLIQKTLRLLRKRAKHQMMSYSKENGKIWYGKLRHLYIICDLIIGIAKGILREKSFHDKDLDRINNIDLSKWLKKHGVRKELVEPPSSVVKALYDSWFAYENGDSNRPNLEAGNGLRVLTLLFTAYKGHPFYLMKVSFREE